MAGSVMAALSAVASRGSSSTCSLTYFTDPASFKAVVQPFLDQDKRFNTLCLSQLMELDTDGSKPSTPGRIMGLIACSTCPTSHSCALICPGLKGIGSQLYISGSVCQHAAEIITQQLQQGCSSCTTLSITAAAARLILPLCKWTPKHGMNVMVLNSSPITAVPAPAADKPTHGSASSSTAPTTGNDNASTAGSTLEAVATAAGKPTASGSSQQELRLCSADSPEDLQLTLQWGQSFLAEVFHMPSPPPLAQVESLVLPRLQQGLYRVLLEGGKPVCMAGHVPTSSNSTRVTMLYTPQESRGKGYGRQAVWQLCKQLQAQGYEHICLMADQDEPAVNRLYQAVGFTTVGEMQMAERPEGRVADAGSNN